LLDGASLITDFVLMLASWVFRSQGVFALDN